MTYSEEIKYDLSRIERLVAEAGHPELSYHTVHIAGTNGKGSTASLIAAGLQATGYKVGLYTSPHLVTWRERIRVNDHMISEEYACAWEEKYQQLLDEVAPSYFEQMTAMAFCYFAEQEVDYAVIECGLGGRLDSTNVIMPVLSVITSIGLDHTALLGDTRAKIAGEKAGIIKWGVPCVVAETDDEIAPVLQAKAVEMNTSILVASKVDCPHETALRGAYQQVNKRTAYCALRALGVAEEAIVRGFREVCELTGLRGRWEVLSEHPLTICDTGHNSHGVHTYAQQLKEEMTHHEHLRIVYGMVSDKDVEQVMNELPREAIYYWTAATTERAIPAEEMMRLGLKHGLLGRAFPTIEDARRAVEIDTEEDDMIFIGGSNYVIGEWLDKS